MNPEAFKFDGPARSLGHVRSGWQVLALSLLRLGPLTDRKIAQYQAAGWYSDTARQARRDLQERRKAKADRREGHFALRDGRMIYSP